MKNHNRIRPVLCAWTGEHFVPLPRFKRLCDQQFAVHEEYALIPSEERSMDSHRGYFAEVREAWNNLAEEFDGRFPSDKHLRSYALVKTGFATYSAFPCKDHQSAVDLAISLRRRSPFSVIKVSDDVVECWDPESQSVANMKKEKFEASKKAVLEFVASMARTTPTELRRNAGRSA